MPRKSRGSKTKRGSSSRRGSKRRYRSSLQLTDLPDDLFNQIAHYFRDCPSAQVKVQMHYQTGAKQDDEVLGDQPRMHYLTVTVGVPNHPGLFNANSVNETKPVLLSQDHVDLAGDVFKLFFGTRPYTVQETPHFLQVRSTLKRKLSKGEVVAMSIALFGFIKEKLVDIPDAKIKDAVPTKFQLAPEHTDSKPHANMYAISTDFSASDTDRDEYDHHFKTYTSSAFYCFKSSIPPPVSKKFRDAMNSVMV